MRRKWGIAGFMPAALLFLAVNRQLSTVND
jgi:hypothetical protein